MLAWQMTVWRRWRLSRTLHSHAAQPRLSMDKHHRMQAAHARTHGRKAHAVGVHMQQAYLSELFPATLVLQRVSGLLVPAFLRAWRSGLSACMRKYSAFLRRALYQQILAAGCSLQACAPAHGLALRAVVATPVSKCPWMIRRQEGAYGLWYEMWDSYAADAACTSAAAWRIAAWRIAGWLRPSWPGQAGLG